VGYFGRVLRGDECAVVVRRGSEPRLIRGPGSVRTLNRWRRVIVVDLRPFSVEVLDENVVSKDGEALTVGGAAEGQVTDPIAAATRVVDHKNATQQIFQTAIRAAVKERPSSEIRDTATELESAVAHLVNEAVHSWGVVVSSLGLHLSTGSERTN
jgi:uncharacterized membrane protein YqiK